VSTPRAQCFIICLQLAQLARAFHHQPLASASAPGLHAHTTTATANTTIDSDTDHEATLAALQRQLTASKLSAQAVTRVIMNGYKHRKRAMQPTPPPAATTVHKKPQSQVIMCILM
jgi:hypothetical protein